MKLSVIIPAYNEEKRLPKTLKAVDEYLRNQNYDYEIIVVNDGSKDDTALVVKDFKPQIVNLRLIDRKENKGKGYTVKEGMLNAKGDYRLFMDADNSTTIDQIEKMWPWFERGYDIVIGSRDIKGAVLDPPQPLYRRLVGKIFRLARDIICDIWGIYDTQCGFKCFKKEVVETIFPKLRIERFAFDVEILLLAKMHGFKIKEIPVYWRNNPDSKVKFKSAIRMGLDLFKIRWYQLKGYYGQKEKRG
ncbi:glycosyltransferase family 2 protein [bacterium]|nr:glycosyltransferase family 2 protein [bacterium]